MTKSASLAMLQVTVAVLVHLFSHRNAKPQVVETDKGFILILYVQTGFYTKIQNL